MSNGQILLLDSQVFGVPHGELSEFQLEWLERKLADAPERHTLLLLHHHPLPAGCSWLDQHSLRNAGELDTVLAKFPRQILAVRSYSSRSWISTGTVAACLATPSTCVQFKPHCSNFTLDTIAPGWRTLELHADGTLTTGCIAWRTHASNLIPLQKATDVYASLFTRFQQLAALCKSELVKTGWRNITLTLR